MGIHCQPVDEGDDDVFNVDILLELGTRLEKRVQCLQMELIGKHLQIRERYIYNNDILIPPIAVYSILGFFQDLG